MSKPEFLNEAGTNLIVKKSLLLENLTLFKSKLKEDTLVMAMVKAVAYGHGSTLIAKELEASKIVNYFGVANIDKGIELRENGITLPIMVTNPIRENFENLIKYKLEPILHNLELAHAFDAFIKKQKNVKSNYPVHIKFNTGMNRFGIELNQTEQFIALNKNAVWYLKSVMSHLSCSDMESENDFTKLQFSLFQKLRNKLDSVLEEKPLYHILNSNGVLRFPEEQHQMVRIGIGLYGATEYEPARKLLKPIACLKTKVAQIHLVNKGESISYARSGRAIETTYIGTLTIGYADGFPRSLGNGSWHFEINGKLYPTIGNVCMDYTMINLGTAKPAIELEENVIVFGGQKSIYDFAKAQGTICYEAMTNIGTRVHRFFFTS